MKPVRLAICSEERPPWRWVESGLAEGLLTWDFFYPVAALYRWFRRPTLARAWVSWQTVAGSGRQHVDVMISHGPGLTFWCSAFAFLRRVQVYHVAYVFNFAVLPTGLKRTLMRWSFSHVDRFVVPSAMERQLYRDWFNLSPDRIDVLRWGRNPYRITASEPIERGRYVCAIGGNARDYRTLAAAMATLPHIPLVLVARPYNLVDVTLPPNIKVHCDVPSDVAADILFHSQFMVLPLTSSQVPCGHVTLVEAMHHGKAVVYTRSEGVAEYLQDGANGLACQPGDPVALSRLVETLWHDPDGCRRLGEQGRQFAARHCTDDTTRTYLEHLLQTLGLIPDQG